MLVNFRFKNYRSFLDETVLSMEASSDDSYTDFNTIPVNPNLIKGTNALLKTALIFGANASGKTNVLKALYFMKKKVVPIVRRVKNEPYIFLFNNTLPTLFEVEILIDNKFYVYGFTILDDKIKEEWLKVRNNSRMKIIFDRNSDFVKGWDKSITNVFEIDDESLILSYSANLKFSNDAQCVLKWFKKLTIILNDDRNIGPIADLENEKYRLQALDIIKHSDIGVSDIKYENNEFNIDNISNIMDYKRRRSIFSQDLNMQYSIFDINNNEVGTKIIKLLEDRNFNSDGTRKLIFILGAVLKAIDKGNVILLDEIDARLHFLVANYILSMFNSIDKNPNNVQLIATAHEIMLMDESLRRDQIYFASKDKYGRSALSSLSDYVGVRKNDLFGKKYLAGFYSAIPDLKRGE